ncbi:type I polyketide synthase [Streptomyces capparidis]
MEETRETGRGGAIAVVGAACRLPGGINDLDELWRALEEGRDLVGRVPQDRFEADRFVDTARPRVGKSYTAAGGFLDDVAGFDAAYFGISPKEAAHMDPQHRLLLELAAEAMDDAAVDPAALAGSDTGVYVGISDASYGGLQMTSLRTVGPYTMSGAASSIAANRVSHTFDLRGPSVAVDTACSSALFALDAACRALRDSTCRVALCGGVNVLLSPYHYIGFCQASMLSVRGRCASFSADADGFVRAEGGGVVVLKRLADALVDGDRVHGVILGTATNNDGRTLGLALPSAQAQEDLLRRAYAETGVHPDELVYFEAHGTGTPVGDPLEAVAIGRALGIRRITGELPIGSVKTNVGHLEPASGMAGLCKALLVLRHGIAPPSLHALPPHPDIDFAGLGLAVTSEARRLPARERPVVGVNSFGFGGANAHVVLTGPPPAPEPATEAPPVPPEGLPVLVTARTADALSEAAARMARRLADAQPGEYHDIAHTSCLRRGRHEHRAVVLARTAREAAREFTALAGGAGADGPGGGGGPGGAGGPGGEGGGAGADGDGTAADGQLPPYAAGDAVGAVGEAVATGRVVYVFTGNGSQWAGMAADLLPADPAFARAVAEADAELAPLLGWSVTDELALPPRRWRLADTEVASPLLFAVQLGLVAALRSRGVEPSLVLGHSIGEVAAAHTSGALSLPQAARVLVERGRAQAAGAGGGRMAAVGLPVEQAAGELAPYGRALEIAAVNGPKDVTVSGRAAALAALGERLTARGVFFRDLGLDYAFHNRCVEGSRASFTAALSDLAPARAAVPLYSTVTGARAAGPELDARYWWRNLRHRVRFHAAVEQAIADGGDVFVEIGPHSALRTYLRRIAAGHAGTGIAVLPTLRRGGDGPREVATVPAALLAAGAQADWKRHFPVPGRVTTLPAYPWRRTRHWSGTPRSWVHSSGDGVRRHPLLGERLPSPLPVWEGEVEPVAVPWLADHRVAGSVVMPATGFAEMALAAGRLALGGPVEADHLDITGALVVAWPDASAVRTQVALNPDDGALTVSSTDEGGGEPRTHARARVRALLAPRPAPLDPAALRQRCPRAVTGEEHYRACARAGLTYGPEFQVLRRLAVGDREVLAAYRHDAPGDPYTAHPALLDGALQAGAPLLAERLAEGHAHLPSGIDAVRVWAAPSAEGLVWVRERDRTDTEVCWDITVADPDGTVTARLDGCRLRRLPSPHRTPVTVHQPVLRAAPHEATPCDPSPLPAPKAILAAAGERIARLRAAWRESRYDRLAPLQAEVTARGCAQALAALLPDPEAPFTADSLVAAGMPERYRGIVPMLTGLLERHGLLRRDEDGRARLTAADGRPSGCDEALALAPAFVTETAFGAYQGMHFREVLSGAQDPLELLVADSAVQVLEQFYDIAPMCRFHNRVAQALVREAVRRWPGDRPLRVLEIGAGTGGTTAALLPLLPPDRTRYCFTDTSAFFLPRARKRFAAHDFVEYRTFDLDTDPAEQGFPPHGFDLVVAANSLHTAKDLEAALRRVRTLLAPGGHLLAVEPHDPEALLLFFGGLASFHGHTDTELRPQSLLLPRDRWPTLLRRCGYAGVVRTGDDAPPARDQFSVFLAAAPRRPVRQAPALPAPGPGTTYVVATESPRDRELAHAVAGALTEAGAGSVRVGPATDDARGWRGLLAVRNGAPEAEPPVLAVALLLGGDPPADPGEAVAVTTRRLATLRALAAARDRLPDGVTTQVWLVTGPGGALPDPAPGTESASADPPAADPIDAAAWGAARCLANERPDLHGRRVALHRTADPAADGRRLAGELLSPTDEDEIVLTPAGRFVPREVPRPAARPATGRESFALRVREPGLAYRLAWQEVPRPVPGPGEVLVEVRAAALNYRDVMQCAGVLPREAFEGTLSDAGPGMECAGVVVACGPEVAGLAPGDRVAGIGPASLASHVVTSALAVRPFPGHLTFAEAATAPVAFATVHYGLGHLARLAEGETVLVHGAAGGVGLAALQYARAHGARVIATAGSDLKRDFLRALGVEHVLDSRTLGFAPRVMEITQGRGVDVVLNSLAGEAITRSLELLRPGGRFVELGKRDILENRPLGMRALGQNVAFFGVDLTKVLEDPATGARLLAEIDDLTARRAYRPLPHSVFPAARVEEAFRLLQHSRHIGKVVVAFDPLDEPPLVEPAHRAPRLDPEGTYLVTGGTGGFGAATAEWLARLGARRLALVSRRGPAAPEAAAVAARLAGQGASAVVYAADAGDPHAMRRVVEEIDASGHPLRGVAHCAMHLDDAPLAELTPERIAAVLAPKLGGAAVLDRLTRDRECDLFLLHSSTTTVIGAPTQAPYVAANLYLEALARRRHRSSGAGLAVAWGAISDVGYVARNDLTGSLAALGLEAVAPHEAFAAAERLLGTGTAVAAVARVDWSRAGSLLPLTSSPRLSAVVPDHGADGGMSAEDLRRALAGMSGEEALAFIADSLTTSLAEVLHMDPGQLDHHRRLDEYGVDSLMAAELLVSVHKRYRVDIPPMELLRSRGTIADIARTIHVRLGLSGLPDTTAVPGPRAAREDEPAPLPAADPAQPQ